MASAKQVEITTEEAPVNTVVDDAKSLAVRRYFTISGRDQAGESDCLE